MSKDDTSPDLLTATEAAELLRVHRQTIARWAMDGTLPGVKVGRDWRFRRADIERLLTPVIPDQEEAG